MDTLSIMLEQLGDEATEESVHQAYDGKSRTEITDDLNHMFPDEPDNDVFAEEIYKFCCYE